MGLLMMSCTTYKSVYFTNKTYSVSKSDLGLWSYCKLEFVNDSILLEESNGGSFYSIGKWEVVDNRIIFHPYSKQEAKSLKLIRGNDFYAPPKDSIIEIRGRNKLLFNGLEYRGTD